MSDVLMVIAPDQFRDEEYARPREVLEGLGATVVTASVAPGPCRGKLGMLARAEVALNEVSPDRYDAIVFVGGAGASVYFDDLDAHALARAMHAAGKVVGAICVAPSTLAHAGLLRGKNATAFASQRDDLIAHGATWTGAPVEIDGSIVTANGPAASQDFGLAIADLLGLSR
ncbi:MAG: DJ-1/PfpI family protein [Actinomycetota bacterium]|nr:DJ-1/PfpI family protein [Actinomycetota bacterium]